MADIKEVIESIKDVIVTPIQEAVEFRAKSAFFGTFVISWVILNWEKIAYFTLSDDNILNRINYLKSKNDLGHFDNHFFFISNNISYPLITALLFTLGYPLFMWFITWIHKAILTNIDILSETRIKAALKRQEEIDKLKEENEGKKLTERAKQEKKYSTDRLDAIKETQQIDQLITEVTDKRLELDKITGDIDIQKKILENIGTRIAEATTEHADLESKVGPLKTQSEIYGSILNQSSEQHAELMRAKNDLHMTGMKVSDQESLIQKLKSAYNERVQYETVLLSKLTAINNFQEHFGNSIRTLSTSFSNPEDYNVLTELNNGFNHIMSSREYLYENSEPMNMDHIQ